jgi:hypothetical protein
VVAVVTARGLEGRAGARPPSQAVARAATATPTIATSSRRRVRAHGSTCHHAPGCHSWTAGCAPASHFARTIVDRRSRENSTNSRRRRVGRGSEQNRRPRSERPPPPGAEFYPFYSTANFGGTCTWQEGGNLIPGNHEQLRGELHRRVRPIAADRVPRRRIHDCPAVQQLQERQPLQPCRLG